ncbi:MAG: NADPH-dependent glutamate synthase [Ruminococcus sp.]|jgi:glutamate synthase (NADPH/NADH) small chain|nr:NADPH-dependent glutamate synthase [Ruminococcus sp.]
MPDMSPMKNPMPVRDPYERNRDFAEVALGYDKKTAVAEAARCLGCKNKPCVAGCPVGIDIPRFIEKIKNEDFGAAYDVIAESSSLPAVCGRVCPQETQCEGKCVRGIKNEPVAVGRLERFAADYRAKNPVTVPLMPIKNNIKCAVVGSGPAGLACAGELLKNGFSVTIFEALHAPGGVLRYGIPEFRLPKAIVDSEIEGLRALGAEILTNTVIGRTLTVDDLIADGFKYVFIGTGAGLPNFMKIPGENLKGVYSANEYLTRINLMKAYDSNSDTPAKVAKRAVIVGGGNVAMDAARCAKRLGAKEVYIVYRRSEAEMPARLEEVEHAKEEGIVFKTLTNPVRIIEGENGFAKAVECVEMTLGEPDENGRRKPYVKPGSEFIIETDCIIMSIGTSPNPLIKDTTAIDVNRWGGIITDDDGKTSLDCIYAGGDAVTGAATVILAMGAGKKAAETIAAGEK